MRMSIKLLGSPVILDAAGRTREVRGYKAWALLARALLTRAPLDRRNVAAELFPEADDPLASVRGCLASLRKALALPGCLRGDPIVCGLPADVSVDVWRLDCDGIDVGQAGVLLEGIEVRASPEFSTWLLIERERVASVIDARIRQETIRALSTADYDRAIRLAERGVHRSSYQEGSHVLLIKSLAMAGRYDAALSHVIATEALFLAEFGEKPSIALRSAARRTIASAPSGVSPAAFVKSLMDSGQAALAAGATDAGVECLRRAAHDAEKIGDRHLLSRALLELGTALVHAVRGYDDEGSIVLSQSTELARQSGYATIASAGLCELGYVETLAGRRPSAAAYLSEAFNIAEDADSLSGIHAVTGLNLVDWGRVEESLEHFEVSLRHARESGKHRREIFSLGIGARGLMAAGRYLEAQTWLKNCLSLVDEQRWLAFRPWPVALLCESRLRQDGDPGELRAPLEEAFALSCQLADPCWEGAVARALALTYAAEKNHLNAMEWLVEGHRRCLRETDTYAALHVDILAEQVAVSHRLGLAAETDAMSREWIARAARAHMNAHIARAADFIAGQTQQQFRASPIVA